MVNQCGQADENRFSGMEFEGAGLKQLKQNIFLQIAV